MKHSLITKVSEATERARAAIIVICAVNIIYISVFQPFCYGDPPPKKKKSSIS